MPTTILLIRHAAFHGVGDVLAGWTPGVCLTPDGRADAAHLARELARAPVAAVYSSPLERALETAAAIAEPHALRPIEDAALGEVRFGDWSGRDVASLAGDAAWTAYNAFRSGTPTPEGELFVQLQARAVARLLSWREQHADAIVAAVTHADVIRAVLVYFLGMPIDLLLRLEVAPASVSALELGRDHARVLYVNRLAAP